MGSESGSGPQLNKNQAIPIGWRSAVDANGACVYVLDDEHPSFPVLDRGNRPSFSDDERLSREIGKARKAREKLDQSLSAFRVAGGLPTRTDVIRMVSWLNECAAAINHHSGPTFFWAERYAYIVDQILKDAPSYWAKEGIRSRLRMYGNPFRAIVNPGDQPSTFNLYPGETAFVMTDLPTRELPKLGTILTEAREINGHAPAVGRPKRATPKPIDPARTAARLFYEQGRSHRDIANILHCLFPAGNWRIRPDHDRKEEAKRIVHKLRLLIRDGDAALSCDESDDGDAYRKAKEGSETVEKGQS